VPRRLAVAVAGSIHLYCQGLAAILARQGRFDVVGTAARRDDIVQLVQSAAPSILLLDMSMPESTETVRDIAAAAPSVKVVAIAVPDSDRDVIACAEAGVVAYVTRDGSVDDVVEALECVDRKELRCSPRIAALLFWRVGALSLERRDASSVAGPALTAREQEIVELIDGGLSNKEIARRLCIQVATVKNHVHNILEKLQVGCRAEAAAVLRRTPRPALEVVARRD
jgi:two-component system, NarL family, nitrate/nitrite response regulator NarL